VADCQSQGVCRILRRDFRELRQRCDHLRDLSLVGLPVTYDRLLDGTGTVLEHGTRAASSHYRHAASLAENQCGSHVSGGEDLLDGHLVGIVLHNDFGQSIIELAQPLREREISGEANDTEIDDNSIVARTILNGVTRGPGPRIDSENSNWLGFRHYPGLSNPVPAEASISRFAKTFWASS
jgi:hypothetical protein